MFCKDLRGSTTSAVGVAKIMHDVFFTEMESLLDGVWIYVVQCCGCRRRSKKQEEENGASGDGSRQRETVEG